MKRMMVAYILYVFLGSVIFKLITVQRWSWAQCIYYAMTVGLSIGYGAMQPASQACKTFAIIYVIIGACAVALLLAVFVRTLLNLVPKIAAEEWRHQAKVRRYSTAGRLLNLPFVAPRWRVDAALWFALVSWTAVGTVWAHDWQGPNVQSGQTQWSWLTSIFFAVGTLTTAGLLGPQLDEEGKVPSDSAAFLAFYSIVGVPLFGAAVSHAASSYVEGQVRRQERELIGSRLSVEEFAAVRELRYGSAAARRSTRGQNASATALFGFNPRRSFAVLSSRKSQGAKQDDLASSAELRLTTPATKPGTEATLGDATTPGICAEGTPGVRMTTAGERNTSGERVLWGDFLALQLLRLRKVDFEFLKDLREEYLEMISANPSGGGLNWDMLTPLLAENAPVDAEEEEEDLERGFDSSAARPSRDVSVSQNSVPEHDEFSDWHHADCQPAR